MMFAVQKENQLWTEQTRPATVSVIRWVNKQITFKWKIGQTSGKLLSFCTAPCSAAELLECVHLSASFDGQQYSSEPSI
jgi:hypothetical protein